MLPKKKSCLIFDYGTSISLAQRMSREGRQVFYYAPWHGPFPKTDRYYLGENVDGVTSVESFFDYIDKVDFIFFPDIYEGDLQHYLREAGYRVAGSGRAEKLEIDRVWFYSKLKELGQPSIPYKVIRGLSKLSSHLGTVKDKYIKFPYFRGSMESAHHVNYEHSISMLDRASHQMGPAREDEDFIVQDPIHNAVEIGYDGYCCLGEFPKNPIIGLEIKDKCYVAKVFDEYPKLVRRNNEAFAPLLKEMGMQGLYSTELRVVNPNTAYFIDPCARMGFPSGNAVSELYGNYAEIIEGLADQKLVEPKPVAKYAAELIISSDNLKHDWLAVDVPAKYGSFMKLKNICKIRNQIYCIPQDDIGVIGSAVGIGDTLNEAIEMALEVAESVKSQDGSFYEDSFGKVFEEIEKIKDITKGDIDLD